MNLSIDKSFFVLQKYLKNCKKLISKKEMVLVLLSFFSIMCFSCKNQSIIYANYPIIVETPDITIEEQYKIANERRSISPIDYEYYNGLRNEITNNRSYENTIDANLKNALLNYFNEELLRIGNLTNYHEENYYYTDGRREQNIYNGVIGYSINDFDNDSIPEIAIFEIKTDLQNIDALKHITVDIVKIINGLPYIVASQTIYECLFDAETIGFDLSVKKYNDFIRIYFNYFEKRYNDDSIQNVFKAYELNESLNLVGEAYYNVNNDDYYFYDDNYDFTNIAIDAGVDVRDNNDIVLKTFINDDANMKPVVSFNRVNENMKDGYLENYINDNIEELERIGFLKIRYGYTNIIMR